MKKIVLALLGAAASILLYAQVPDWQWARYATGAGAQETLLVSTDPWGNVYLAGNFQNDITFGSTTVTMFGVGMYLAKFDAAGNLLWLRYSGGIGSNGVYQLATDKSGNTYIAGRFANQISFGAFTLTSVMPTITHIFVAKYDTAGNVLWARSAGEAGNGNDLTWTVHVDGASNVYLAGSIQSDTVALDVDTLFATGGDFCLIKYDSSGHELWARSASAHYFALPQDMTSDSKGNLYVTGFFLGDSLSFPSATIYNQGLPALQDLFFVSYDSSGNFRWAKGYGGHDVDIGYGVVADGADNIYLTGGFNSPSVTFDAYTANNPSGQYAYFLSKYDSSGNMRWMKSDSGSSQGYCLVVDSQSNLYFTGYFYSPTFTLDTITLQRPSVYADPMFIAKLDSSGHIFWGKALGSGGDDQNGVALGINGDIFIGGDFYTISPFVIGNDSLILTGIENAFIAKLGFNTVIALLSAPDHVICPGTCVSFNNNSVNATSFQWFFPGSSTPVSTDVSPSNICYNTPGQYDVTLIASGPNGTDTLTLQNYITVYPYPPPKGISQNGDTLFANQGAVSYQWYFNGNIINGATEYFYIAPQSGDYNVIAADANGCEVEAVIFNVVAGLFQVVSGEEGIVVFPNPVKDQLTMHIPIAIGTQCRIGAAVDVSIYNVLGERVHTVPLPSILSPQPSVFDVSSLPSGMYYLELKSPTGIFRTRFLKSNSR